MTIYTTQNSITPRMNATLAIYGLPAQKPYHHLWININYQVCVGNYSGQSSRLVMAQSSIVYCNAAASKPSHRHGRRKRTSSDVKLTFGLSKRGLCRMNALGQVWLM